MIYPFRDTFLFQYGYIYGQNLIKIQGMNPYVDATPGVIGTVPFSVFMARVLTKGDTLE